MQSSLNQLMFTAALLLFAQTTAFPSINKLPLPTESTKFDFVVMGDNRPVGAGLPATATFRELLSEVSMVGPSFVLSSGDLVYGNEEPIAQYRHELNEIQGLIGKLQMPFFNAPGNHEINGRADFQSEYTSRFGPMYGSFEYGGWKFVALATDQADATASMTPDEMTYISRTIDGSKPTCVFMHRPCFARKPDPSDAATVAQGPQLHEIFKSHNVKAVFQGHDHVYFHQQKDGIEYYISGGAGAPLDATPPEGGFFHFLIVHAEGDHLTFDVIPLGSLNLSEIGGKWMLANYTDSDIQAHNVILHSSRKPSSVTAQTDKKGKFKAVPSTIVKTEQAKGGWDVHVSVFATKHVKTVLELTY